MDKSLKPNTGIKMDKNKKEFPLLNFNHIRRFSIVIATTVTIIAVFVGIGYWLDTKLDTKPWILIVAVVLSFPVTQFALYKKMKEYSKKEFKRLDIKTK